MRVLITGVCGFAGSAVAEALLESLEGVEVAGIDNLSRPGSETNRARLRRLGVEFVHGDVRLASDWEALPAADWVIDAAANPSVLAGLGPGASARQLFEGNLGALGHVLDYCRGYGAGLLLLSSSRVYSIRALSAIALAVRDGAFVPRDEELSRHGIGVDFPVTPPVSLYGATKLASETLAIESGEAFGFPVWVTRCGTLAGAGQFGTANQGIFAFWINSHLRRRPLRYTGFDGTGHQTRDALHPRDLARLLTAQMRSGRQDGQRVYTAGGGTANARSLAQLTRWCDARFGPHAPVADPHPRPYDVPWIAMDNRDAARDFGWRVETPVEALLDEIAAHAGEHPEWLETSGA
ncbi:MAG: NAD-dependent epimerase/dehydratase family protein [Bryobacterales bacterium]|nr:NAD-dependent epimerase/dehydratase family protein [Bryobacterales bacterium]